jgi:poly(A) polymerase
MLRALRFVAKLDFELDKTAAQPIAELAHLLDEVPAARLFDEVLKLFQKGHALNSFNVLREHNLFSYLFLQAEEALAADQADYIDKIIRIGLENTDRRVQEGKSVNPAFLFAFFLWGALRDTLHTRNENLDHIPAIISAAQEVFSAQIEQTSLPKRFSIQAREIWALQPRFDQRRGKRPLRLLSHPRFRAAYDFLLLRNEAGEDLQEQCDWWTEFQELDENKQIQETRGNDRNRSRRSRGRGRGRKPQQDESSPSEG